MGMLKELDRLKWLYKERYLEEVYYVKYNEGAECKDTMKKMRLGVDSEVFIEEFLSEFPWKVVSKRNGCYTADDWSDMYIVKFRLPIWKRAKDIISMLKSVASKFTMISIGDYEGSDKNEVYIHVRFSKCFNEQDTKIYEELNKKHNDVQWELECLDKSYANQIRDWEIECISGGSIFPFCFYTKDIEL